MIRDSSHTSHRSTSSYGSGVSTPDNINYQSNVISPNLMNYQSAMQKMYAAELQFHTREADRAKEKQRKTMHQTQLLKEQVISQQKELKKLQKEKRSFLQEKSSLNKTIVELQEDRRKLRSLLAKSKDEEKNLLLKHKTAMNEMVQRMTQEGEKLRAYERKNESLSEEIEILKENNVDIRDYERLEEECLILKQREGQVKEQMRDMQYELQRLQNAHRDGTSNLTSQIDTLKDELDRERQGKADAEAQNRKLYHRIETVMEQHSKLQKVSFEFERLMRENNSKNDDIFDLQEKHRKLTTEAHELQEKKIELERELAEKDTVFQRERDGLQREIRLREDELGKKRQELGERESRIQDLREQLDAVQSQTKKMAASHDKLLSRSQKKEAGLKTQLENRKAECILLNGELERVRNDLKAKQETLLEKTKEMQELKIKVRQQDERLETNKGIKAQSSLKLERFESLVQSLRKEVDAAESKTETAQRERDNLQQRVLDLEEKNTKLETRESKFAAERENLKTLSEEKDTQLVQHQLDLAKAREKINILQSQQSKFSEYSNELRTLEREKMQFETEISHQQQKIVELQEKLANHDAMKAKFADLKLELEKERMSKLQAEQIAGKVEGLNSEMLELKQKTGAYESVIDSRNSEVERLERAVKELKAAKEEVERQKQEVASELQAQLKQNQELSIAVRTHDDAKQQIDYLRESKEDLSGKFQKVSEDLIIFKANYEKEADKVKYLESQNADYTEAITMLKETNQKLLFEKERLTEKFDENLEARNKEIERLNAEIEQFQMKQKKGTEVNQKEIRESRQEISRLRVLNDQMTRDIERHKEDVEQLNEMKDANRDLRLKSQRMEGELESAKSNNERMEEHTKQLEDKLSSGLVKMGHLNAQKEELEAKLAHSENEIRERTAELKSLSEKCFKLEGEHRSLSSREESYKQMQTQLEEQTVQIANFKRDNAELNEKYELHRKESKNAQFEMQQRNQQLSTDKDNLWLQITELRKASSEKEKQIELIQVKLEEAGKRLTLKENEAESANKLIEKQYNDILTEKETHLKNELLVAKLTVEKENLVRENAHIKVLEEEKKELEAAVQQSKIDIMKMEGELADEKRNTEKAQKILDEFEMAQKQLTALEIERNKLDSKVESLEKEIELILSQKKKDIAVLKAENQILGEGNEQTLESLTDLKETVHNLKTEQELSNSKVEFLKKEKEEVIKRYEEKMTLTTQRLADAKEQQEQLIEARKSSESERNNLLKELWQVKDDLNKYTNESHNLKKERTEWRKEQQELKRANAELEQLYENVVNSRRIIETEMSQLSLKSEEESRSLHQQIASLEETVTAGKEARQRRDEEITNLRNDVLKQSERNKILTETNRELGEKMEEFNTLKQQYLEEQMEKQHETYRSNDLQERCKELKEEKEKMVARAAAQEERLVELQKRVDAAEHKSFTTSSQAEILKVQLSQLEKRKNEFEKLEVDYTGKTKEIVVLQTKLETTKSQCREYEQQLQEKRSAYDSIKVELQYSKVAEEQLTNDLTDLKSRLSEIESDAQSNRIALETTRREKEKLDSKVKKLSSVETELALETERRKNLESQLESLEEQQANAVLSLGDLTKGASVTEWGPGGEHTPDSRYLGHEPSMEQQQLSQLMSRISQTGEMMAKQHEEFSLMLKNSDSNLEGIVEDPPEEHE